MSTDWLTFFIAISVLTLTPGADTLVVMRNTARSGLADGLTTSLGICMALYVHAIVSAIGLAVVLAQTPAAFSVIKTLGACYLIYLGVQSLRPIFGGSCALAAQDKVVKSNYSATRSLREGFLSNALNPKTAIFYLAFLPQFIDPAYNAVTQALFLAFLHFCLAMLWQGAVALGVNKMRVWLLKPRVQAWFGGITGSVLVALGGILLLNKTP